eukprot:m.335097 g.335097  ORF g.335097 m.335097 type:complete len:168 (-) comp20522_c0_seq5:443-946(-)
MIFRGLCEVQENRERHGHTPDPWREPIPKSPWGLCVTCNPCNRLMELFPWGPEFLRVNHEVLEMYSAAPGPDAVRAAEAAYLAAGQKEHELRRAEAQASDAQGDYLHGMDLPSMTSSEDEEEQLDEESGDAHADKAPSDDVDAVQSLLDGCSASLGDACGDEGRTNG